MTEAAKADMPSIDELSLEQLVELKEKVEKKIATDLAAAQAAVEKRQAELQKLADRASGKSPAPRQAPPRAPKTTAKTAPQGDGKPEGGSDQAGAATPGETAAGQGDAPVATAEERAD